MWIKLHCSKITDYFCFGWKHAKWRRSFFTVKSQNNNLGMLKIWWYAYATFFIFDWVNWRETPGADGTISATKHQDSIKVYWKTFPNICSWNRRGSYSSCTLQTKHQNNHLPKITLVKPRTKTKREIKKNTNRKRLTRTRI